MHVQIDGNQGKWWAVAVSASFRAKMVHVDYNNDYNSIFNFETRR